MTEGKILLITEEEDDIKMFSSILSHKGFNPVGLSDNNTSLSIILETEPDLILINHIQFTINGVEFFTKLKSRLPTIPIVVYSVQPSNIRKSIEGFIQAGVYDYLTYPFDINELIAIIKKALAVTDAPRYASVQIVERLFAKIEWHQEIYRQLNERYQWYKENAGDYACDCLELGENKNGKEPKSTALRNVGTVYCTPYDPGHCYVCEACGTRWIEWEPGIGFPGGWEVADEDNEFFPSDEREKSA